MMEHAIIKSLFYGEFSELEGKVSPQTQEQKTMLHELDALLGELLEKLSPDDRKKLEDFDVLLGQLSLVDEEQSFAYGLRLGVRLMCEVFLPVN